MDKNIAAFLDENAYTVRVKYQQGSGRAYTYVTNIHGIQEGDVVVVPVGVPERNAGEINAEVQAAIINALALKIDSTLVPAPQTREEFMQQEGSHAKIDIRITRFIIAVVVAVDEDVNIAPDSDIEYSWVATKLDMLSYAQTMQRNAEVVRVATEAYQRNMRRSFRERIMSELDDDTRARLASLSGNSLPAPKKES